MVLPAMAAKRKRNAPETIILRAVNPAEPPKRSRKPNPLTWVQPAAGPPPRLLGRSKLLKEEAQPLLKFKPRTKAQQRRLAQAELWNDIYEHYVDLDKAGYGKEAEEMSRILKAHNRQVEAFRSDLPSNPRAKPATATTAGNAEVAVDYFLTHRKVPRGMFGAWGLDSPGGTKYAYGEGRVPTQVIDRLGQVGTVFADEDADIIGGDELLLTIQNESRLHPQYQAIAKNLEKKIDSGKYDHAKAVVGWRHWVDAGAKQYAKDWDVSFDVPTRNYVARRVAREFEEEHEVRSSRKRNPPRKANCNCKHENARAKRLRELKEY